MNTLFTLESNTPLLAPPMDYCPSGCARWFNIPTGLDKGKTLFYFDHVVGKGEPQSTVVFVHGNPESSYTYRHIRNVLIQSGQSIRIIAMDHIGFGLSDQASFEMIEMHHAKNLQLLVQHLNLTDVTLAVHDWGGPIGIGAFIQEPWRVRNLVVMNSTVFPMPSDGFTYENYPLSLLPWCHTPKLIADSLWGGMAAYAVSYAGPQSAFKFIWGTLKYTLYHALKVIPQGSAEQVWSQSLRPKVNARSSKRMVRQTPVWGHGYTYKDKIHGLQDNHSFYEFIQNNIASSWGASGLNIEVAGFFGCWDPCGKDSVIDQWQTALPSMKNNTHIFKDIGHFVEEHKGQEIAEAILAMHVNNIRNRDIECAANTVEG